MSKGRVFFKIILAGAAMFGVYKLYKEIEKYDKKVTEHRETVLNEVDGELHEAEEWNKDIKDITLNNASLKPSDRAYSYDILKTKYDAILNGKTIKEIDSARKDFEEFLDILITVKDAETIESLLSIYAEQKNKEEKAKQEKEAREAELTKYRTIGNVIEKIGSKVVCELVQ